MQDTQLLQVLKLDEALEVTMGFRITGVSHKGARVTGASQTFRKRHATSWLVSSREKNWIRVCYKVGRTVGQIDPVKHLVSAVPHWSSGIAQPVTAARNESIFP